jgi:hypothetical protein
MESPFAVQQNQGNPHSLLQILSAYVTENGVVLAQRGHL